MKIAIVGAGAIGGYLGARLSAAGEDVTFIARNRNLQAIRAQGFRLVLEDGTGELLEVVAAGVEAARFTGGLHGRQQEGDEQADDRDDDE